MKREQASNSLYACPCCGYATLSEPAGYEICHICFWEDDGQDDPEEKENWGGPNHVSLKQARFNFIVFGAAEKKDLKHVKAPTESYINLRNYKLVYEIISDKKI